MYNELFAAWQLETQNSELGRLPPDFYARLIDYLHSISEVSSALSEKNLKASLLEHEATNAKRMVEDLIATRYRKIVKNIVEAQVVPSEMLASEEAQLCSNLSPAADAYNRFASALLAGQAAALATAPPVKVEAPKPETEKVESKPASTAIMSTPISATASLTTHRRVAVRFLKQVPSIIGSDMKTYGPFMVEDVASVPESNARILVRQGLAKLVELP